MTISSVPSERARSTWTFGVVEPAIYPFPAFALQNYYKQGLAEFDYLQTRLLETADPEV